jgi:predicted RNA binding protein YcfA (HicA-like mRNA interferase family)
MSKQDKLLEKVLSGKSDAGIRFGDLCSLLTGLGFTLRVRGSHHNFRRQNFDDINLQAAGKDANPYQVRQVREILRRGNL